MLHLLFVLAMAPSAWAADVQWRGAAFEGDRAALEKLAQAGAKVVRVYRESDAWVLDEAQRLGMRVVMGLWVAHPRHGFRLDDANAVRRQEQAIRAFVLRYRDHPALLAWGIGNEVETGEADPLPVWREVDRLARVVKALDPKHETMMVVPDGGPEHLKRLADCCPNVDRLGINVYAGAAFNLPQRVREAGIRKPVVVTELGPLGQWQAGRKPWGAPVELTSSEKAGFFRDAVAYLQSEPAIGGVFPFLWGAKQEQTETWHGLLLADGSLTEMTDALSAAWGRPVETAAPAIRGIGIAADTFSPGAEISAGVDALSFDGSPLQAEWKVVAEARDLRLGGDNEAVPPRVPVRVLQADARSVRFVAPSEPGAYRLFLTIRDRSGKAATANLPFLVR
ncbi:glycoside hydrolase family 2 TIM barrel-domain containing protein [Azoarcus sp. KH32C]|uniref:glycoside hydrolase family 2 TIM barrel-domain containing protein n=1 Tax=Azoarcus sp. KH32C TaxID=748247 RepID=UPI0005A0BE9E|nr:glycoside hydrolase family 2 TIM barrel-domain containing protein [Azoarcus sp. KH32C]